MSGAKFVRERAIATASLLCVASFIGSALTTGGPRLAFAALGAAMACCSVVFIWKPEWAFFGEDTDDVEYAERTTSRASTTPLHSAERAVSLLPNNGLEVCFVALAAVVGVLIAAASVKAGTPLPPVMVGFYGCVRVLECTPPPSSGLQFWPPSAYASG